MAVPSSKASASGNALLTAYCLTLLEDNLLAFDVPFLGIPGLGVERAAPTHVDQSIRDHGGIGAVEQGQLGQVLGLVVNQVGQCPHPLRQRNRRGGCGDAWSSQAPPVGGLIAGGRSHISRGWARPGCTAVRPAGRSYWRPSPVRKRQNRPTAGGRGRAAAPVGTGSSRRWG